MFGAFHEYQGIKKSILNEFEFKIPMCVSSWFHWKGGAT